MFDGQDCGVGLFPGEGPEDLEAEDMLAFEVTCRVLADGPVVEDRFFLPDLESIPPGPFLAVVLEHVDRSKLNGFDLVEVLKARERLIAHVQAGSAADTSRWLMPLLVMLMPCPCGMPFPDEFAGDELRPALHITRNAADLRLSLAFDLCQRLPRL